jgi:hypothetical protein
VLTMTARMLRRAEYRFMAILDQVTGRRFLPRDALHGSAT